jgi:hypothetical protein
MAAKLEAALDTAEEAFERGREAAVAARREDTEFVEGLQNRVFEAEQQRDAANAEVMARRFCPQTPACLRVR